MLTLTDNAVTAIRALISQPEQAPDAVSRPSSWRWRRRRPTVTR